MLKAGLLARMSVWHHVCQRRTLEDSGTILHMANDCGAAPGTACCAPTKAKA